jgi:hypothetical protein
LTIEWSGLNLSFSRYVPNFDTNIQGTKALLSHTIKVQFPDLHEQFKNVKSLTIMASKIGDVLGITSTDLYMKRPAGPMITMEVFDISKLVGYIRIPSMVERASMKDTTSQRILYSSLPNQCRKCPQFKRFTQACTIPRTPIWEGITPTSNLPTWSKKIAHGPTTIPMNQNTYSIHKNGKRQGNWSKHPTKGIGLTPPVEEIKAS